MGTSTVKRKPSKPIEYRIAFLTKGKEVVSTTFIFAQSLPAAKKHANYLLDTDGRARVESVKVEKA